MSIKDFLLLCKSKSIGLIISSNFKSRIYIQNFDLAIDSDKISFGDWKFESYQFDIWLSSITYFETFNNIHDELSFAKFRIETQECITEFEITICD